MGKRKIYWSKAYIHLTFIWVFFFFLLLFHFLIIFLSVDEEMGTIQGWMIDLFSDQA